MTDLISDRESDLKWGVTWGGILNGALDVSTKLPSFALVSRNPKIRHSSPDGSSIGYTDIRLEYMLLYIPFRGLMPGRQ